MEDVEIRKLRPEEADIALNLSLHVFLECGTADYDEEGINSFKQFISDKEHTDNLTLYGAFLHKRLVGVLGTKNAGSHISLFFIDRKYQGQGIGRRMFRFFRKDMPNSFITVNSSTYAVGIYEKFGFVRSGESHTQQGLTSVPMEYRNI